MEKKLFAFWSYDIFPFVLGGEVVSFTESGAVEIKNYGSDYYFKPVKILKR
jgi:hypothetical protein